MFSISRFKTVPNVIFGCGAIHELGNDVKRLGGTKVALVTDAGVVNAKVHEPALNALSEAGLKPVLFSDVESDPKIEIANSCLSCIRQNNIDLVVGLGGGSSLDIAKAAAVMINNERPINECAGVNLVPHPGIPTILIPTTAGTGSEVTSISILSDTINKLKVGVVSDYLFADTALLDPELTLKLPPHVTAYTGLDALIHAIESYTGSKASFLTEPLALSAIELISNNLRKAYADGSNLDARSNMLKASLLAGKAFANTQTAGAHACALALGERFHIPHGIATSLMLPSVMSFNIIATPEKYANIAHIFGEPASGLNVMDQAEMSVKAVKRLIEDVGFTLGLENYEVTKDDIPEMAKGALIAKRLWENNPRKANVQDISNIFNNAFNS